MVCLGNSKTYDLGEHGLGNVFSKLKENYPGLDIGEISVECCFFGLIAGRGKKADNLICVSYKKKDYFIADVYTAPNFRRFVEVRREEKFGEEVCEGLTELVREFEDLLKGDLEEQGQGESASQ